MNKEAVQVFCSNLWTEVQQYAETHPGAAWVVAIAIVAGLMFVLYTKNDQQSAAAQIAAPSLPGVFSHINASGKKADAYTSLHYAEDVETRKARAQEMTNYYYDLVTSFYEYGWGDSFHFAPRFVGESFRESIFRHEQWLGAQLQLHPGQKVVDVGCGVGGPARTIARFTGAHVTGLNNNQNQVMRASIKAEREGLGQLCSFVKGDFTKMPFPAETFDAAFAVEATCHSPNRIDVFSEIYRVLKPGGVFGSYEWVVTDKYDRNNAYHREVVKGIEAGDSLPELVDEANVIKALVDAGFEVEYVRDLALKENSPVPWWQPFIPAYTWENIKSTPVGLAVTHTMVTVMEFLGLAPKGSVTIHTHLRTAARTLREGGELGIFTPMLFVKARKPLTAHMNGDHADAAAGHDSAKSSSGRRRSVSRK